MRALTRAKAQEVGGVGPEFHVEVRLRNNRLRSRREALGLTMAELCERLGCSVSAYWPLEAIRGRRAKRLNGEWSRIAKALARFYRTTEDDLFPEAVLAVTNPLAVRELDASDVAMLAAERAPPALPCEAVDQADRTRAIREALMGLTEREREVLRLRYEEDMQMADIGKRMDISRGRVGQIEAKALRKMRHPNLAKQLLPFVPEAERWADPRLYPVPASVRAVVEELVDELGIDRAAFRELGTGPDVVRDVLANKDLPEDVLKRLVESCARARPASTEPI